MTVTILFLLIAQPVLIACLATTLALSYKRHPVSQGVIIPDADKSPAPPILPENDPGSWRKVLSAVTVATGVAVFYGVLLWSTTHPPEASSGPQLEVSTTQSNAAIIGLMALFVVTQVGLILSIVIWRTVLRSVLFASVCVAVLGAWVFIDSWITSNLMTAMACVVAAGIMQSRTSFLRLSLILSIVAVLYDAVQVFGTGNMVKSVEATVSSFDSAERIMTLPGLLIIPDSFALQPDNFGILGGGDVIVLCLMCIAAARYGRLIGIVMQPVLLTLAGFVVAMLICNAARWYFDAAQPALIYIVPCCAAPVLLFAKRRGATRHLTTPFYSSPLIVLRDRLREARELRNA